jgi:Family of unknown function (DUF5681)
MLMSDRPQDGPDDNPRPDDNQPAPERQLPPARHRVRLVAVSTPPIEESQPVADPEPQSEPAPAASDASASTIAGEYEVGYKKPPRHTQFKKGQVANPLGRPKGAKSLSTLVDEALSAQIKVKMGGRTLTTTKRDAMVKQYVEKAMRGDMKAFAMLVKLDPKAQIPASHDGAGPASQANDDDIAAVAAFLNRHTQPEEDDQ